MNKDELKVLLEGLNKLKENVSSSVPEDATRESAEGKWIFNDTEIECLDKTIFAVEDCIALPEVKIPE